MDLDGLRGKAEDFAKDHDEQIDKGIDKGEDFAKDRVSGHDEQIEQGADKLRGMLPHDDEPTAS